MTEKSRELTKNGSEFSKRIEFDGINPVVVQPPTNADSQG